MWNSDMAEARCSPHQGAERECGRKEGARSEVTFKSSEGDRGETVGGACRLGS